jgi:hypothetical protein
MCIRAIDYCPPVDITFGAFLRGVITADLDFSPEERESFRIVFVESFREWGIYPRDISSMGIDALAWPAGGEVINEMLADGKLQHMPDDLRVRLGDLLDKAAPMWHLESDRFEVWKMLDPMRKELWKWLLEGDSLGRDYARLLGLEIDDAAAPPTVARGKDGPGVEIHAVRPTLRRAASGQLSRDLVIEITQRRDGYFDPAEQARMDTREPDGTAPRGKPDFRYRSGATILIDPSTSEIRRIIRTPGTIGDDGELDRVRRFLKGESGGSGNAFEGGQAMSLRSHAAGDRDEPFALLHLAEEVR